MFDFLGEVPYGLLYVFFGDGGFIIESKELLNVPVLVFWLYVLILTFLSNESEISSLL